LCKAVRASDLARKAHPSYPNPLVLSTTSLYSTLYTYLPVRERKALHLPYTRTPWLT
jgi:hypothetical protein